MQNIVSITPEGSIPHTPTSSNLSVEWERHDNGNTLEVIVNDFNGNQEIKYINFIGESLITDTIYFTDGTGISVELTVHNSFPGVSAQDGNFIATNLEIDTPDDYTLLLEFTMIDITARPVLPMIYDRTQADVDYVKELREKWYTKTYSHSDIDTWINTDLRGALNRSDLERIETNIQYISNRLNLGLTTCYDESTGLVDIDKIPDTSYFQQLHYNVQAVYNTSRHYGDTPKVPDLPFNDFEKLNAIEKILYDTYMHMISDEQMIQYAGEIYSLNTDDSEAPGYVPEGDTLPIRII